LVQIRRLLPGLTVATYGPWETIGSILSIGVGQTTLLTPLAGATMESTLPLFTWTAVPGALSYKLFYRRIGSTIATSVVLNATQFTPTRALTAAANYEWWVVPMNGTRTGLTSKGLFRTPALTPPPPP
jgi:hypothetical protein